MPRKKKVVSDIVISGDVEILPVDIDEPVQEEYPDVDFVFDTTYAKVLLQYSHLRRTEIKKSVLFSVDGLSDKHTTMALSFAITMLRPGGTLYVSYGLDNPLLKNLVEGEPSGWYKAYTK